MKYVKYITIVSVLCLFFVSSSNRAEAGFFDNFMRIYNPDYGYNSYGSRPSWAPQSGNIYPSRNGGQDSSWWGGNGFYNPNEWYGQYLSGIRGRVGGGGLFEDGSGWNDTYSPYSNNYGYGRSGGNYGSQYGYGNSYNNYSQYTSSYGNGGSGSCGFLCSIFGQGGSGFGYQGEYGSYGNNTYGDNYGYDDYYNGNNGGYDSQYYDGDYYGDDVYR